MPLRMSPLLGGDWLAATNTSLGQIYKMGRPMALHYLQHMFIAPSVAGQAGSALTAARAAAEGLLFGLAQGLPASAAGQSFALPYLLHRTALLPDTDPGAWAVCLLAAAIALCVLLRASWAAVWRSLPMRGRDAGGRREGAPEWLVLLAAILPCWLLQLRLGAWALRFEAAAAVGLLLAVTGQSLYLGERWARGDSGSAMAAGPAVRTQVPIWLAVLGGVAAGFGALPGISAVAILIAVGLYGRLPAEGAARFALMATAAVLALQGLGGLPSVVAQFKPAFLVLAAGSALGAAVGGWLLLVLLRASWQRALPVLASYCTSVGGLLMLFGVLQR